MPCMTVSSAVVHFAAVAGVAESVAAAAAFVAAVAHHPAAEARLIK